MRQFPAHIILKLEPQQPIEIGDFVRGLTAIASEYERFVRAHHPGLADTAQMYVREVRPGSIEADLIPLLSMAAPFIADMEKVLIVEDFVRRWGKRLHALVSGDVASQPSSPGELKDWADAVAAIANDPDGRAVIKAATFEDGERQIRAAFSFTTADARAARSAIEARRRQIAPVDGVQHPRVLMVFQQSNIHSPDVGKRRTGDRAVIESLSTRELPVIYASELARQRIKDEILHAQDNIFKKGFVVDVNVETKHGKPCAYRVTEVYDVIDLPDESEDDREPLYD